MLSKDSKDVFVGLFEVHVQVSFLNMWLFF